MRIEETRTKNLRYLIETHERGSKASFASKLGVSSQQVGQWLHHYPDYRTKKPRYIGSSSCRRIEKVWGLPSGWMDLIHSDQPSSNDENFFEFQLLNIEAAAGHGKETPAYIEPVKAFNVSKTWARRVLGYGYERLKLITAKGTSMSGTIEDGDILFVDTDINYFDGDGVYVLSMDSDVKVKRLQSLPGRKIKVISDNHKFDSPVIDTESGVNLVIHGRVIKALAIKDIV